MLTLAFLLAAAAPQPADLPRWKAQAAQVTITRDDWGIAHVKGRTDADAVFGAIYAQAEDDFHRVERNYLTALGRQAEADGEAAVWDDLRHRLYLDDADLRAAYARTPAPMRKLMIAWADGLNYFLATHPQVKPQVITRFEPWMALSFTEGSIGGDIERINLDQLRAFYDGKPPAIASAQPALMTEPMGSNGIAIGPAKSADGNALLLINPHTSFYFRSELQMTSDEGLNAYGASTWGQFFIYQGFNPQIGWMHTSSTADNVDEFIETIVDGPKGRSYRYGTALRPISTKTVRIRFRQADGSMGSRDFQTFHTHRGPVVRADKGKWIVTALMNRPVEAIQQSWLRTKATDLASFQKIAEFRANSSNNTVFASSKGEIAFLYPQFMPRRNARLDYTKPVDGSDPANDWNGLIPVADLPNAINPGTGWIQNTNNHAWSAAGADSPKQSAFPPYIEAGHENARGEHAMMLLQQAKSFTRDSLLAAAFDPSLPVFAKALPSLAAAYDSLPATDPMKAKLAGPIASLRGWNHQWGATSEPTTLAIFWATEMDRISPPDVRERRQVADWMGVAPPVVQLGALSDAVDRLERDFGKWQIAWGEVNRFQRIANTIKPRFDDAAPSIPVGFVSGNWGSLASFGSQPYPNTKRWYGNYGNSFVAVVEFGPRIRARAVTAGGESGDPKSPHFNDQAGRYASGDFREVYFYPDQLKAHVERVYRPGE